jgi:hypothetical protein
MSKRPSYAIRRLLIGSLILFVLIALPSWALAYSYPPPMTTQYAGLVKPQFDLADYDGTVNSSYSTVYLGNYYSGGEGSGSHPGVDISDGDCSVTDVRAIAEGEIIHITSNWQAQHPDRDPCGNNSALGGWGNYVIIRHDSAPDRNGYSGISYTAYAHLLSVNANIAVGNKVLRGTTLGVQGSTGGSTGPHLHFQMDRDLGPNYSYPFWPIGLDVNSTAWQGQVRQNTYNPGRFVQAHIINTEFLYPGALAQYFDEQHILRDQPHENEIDHEWFLNAPPIPQIYPDNFFVTWDGYINIPTNGSWTFYVTADDGAILFIDNEQVLNESNWRARPATFAVQRYLSEGDHYISLIYNENVDYAAIQLAWQGPNLIMMPLVMKNTIAR